MRKSPLGVGLALAAAIQWNAATAQQIPEVPDEVLKQAKQVDPAQLLKGAKQELDKINADLEKLKTSKEDPAKVAKQREYLELQQEVLDRVIGKIRIERPPDKLPLDPGERLLEGPLFACGAIVLGRMPGVPTTLVRFKKSDVGKLPAGWTAARTGAGEGSIWKVVADTTTPSKSGYAIAQTAESPSGFFNLCVLDKPQSKDLSVSVAFKAVKGKEDRGGGLVWRYQDADNYYLARMNPLENNFRVYKVIAGKRIQLGTREDLKVPAGEWHVLFISHAGDKIECYFDSKKYLTVTDAAITTAGKVGLWTKADAQTYFDDLQVSENGP